MKRRVVITGLGLTTPLGVGLDNVWEKIVAGQSGAGPLTRFDGSAHDTKIAAEVKDFKAEEYIPGRELRRMDLFIQYALAATKVAIQDSGIDLKREDAERVGVIVGTGSRRPSHAGEISFHPSRERTGTHLSVFHSYAHSQRSARKHRNTLRHKRPEPEHRNRVRNRRAFYQATP